VNRREIVERSLVGLAALVCLVLALGLGLLARDVSNSSAAVSQGDVEYRIAPETTGLWRTGTVIPFHLATSLTGTGDVVELRRAVRAMRLARLDDPTASLSDPRVALLRTRRAETRARWRNQAHRRGISRSPWA
jgi:hypothetical protein